MLISVIMPVLNEEALIADAIAAARQTYTPTEVEIVVVDGGSRDQTLSCIPSGIPVLHSLPGRGRQMNVGAAAAQGSILVFCHGDSLLPVGWREGVLRALRDPGVSGGSFQNCFVPETWIIRQRNRWVFPTDWRLMFGDQAMFMRRDIFEKVGGFLQIPLMEDVEMARALHQKGKIVRVDPRLRVKTSSRRFLERGFVRQTSANILSMIRYLYLGATAEDIAHRYRSSRETPLDP